MYSAEISVNGIKGYVGGSNALDLAVGVMACAEAIEQATGGHGVPAVVLKRHSSQNRSRFRQIPETHSDNLRVGRCDG